MKPEEKAYELIKKYTVYTLTDFSDKNFEQTKQCALILVDEIMDLDSGDSVDKDYWNEVKQELYKL